MGNPEFGRTNKRNCPYRGRHPSKLKQHGGKHTNCLRRFQCIPLRLELYGWMKRSLTFVRVLGSPRNKLSSSRNKNCFLHFYPEIFYFISSFSTFVSKFSDSGMNLFLLLAQSRDRMEFRGPGLTQSEHHVPRCLLEPKRGLLVGVSLV